jgi:hypothetical protein
MAIAPKWKDPPPVFNDEQIRDMMVRNTRNDNIASNPPRCGTATYGQSNVSEGGIANPHRNAFKVGADDPFMGFQSGAGIDARSATSRTENDYNQGSGGFSNGGLETNCVPDPNDGLLAEGNMGSHETNYDLTESTEDSEYLAFFDEIMNADAMC